MNESGFGQRQRLRESWAEAEAISTWCSVMPCDWTAQQGQRTDTEESPGTESWGTGRPRHGQQEGGHH